MSLGYKITAKIEAKFAIETISEILAIAHKKDCTFFMPDLNVSDPEGLKSIDLNSLEHHFKNNVVQNELLCVTMKYKKTFFDCYFTGSSDTTIEIGNISYPLIFDSSTKQEDFDLDLDPYVRFMLNLILGKKIILLTAQKGWV